jgi:hypothetical protein
MLQIYELIIESYSSLAPIPPPLLVFAEGCAGRHQQASEPWLSARPVLYVSLQLSRQYRSLFWIVVAGSFVLREACWCRPARPAQIVDFSITSSTPSLDFVCNSTSFSFISTSFFGRFTNDIQNNIVKALLRPRCYFNKITVTHFIILSAAE